MAKVIEGRYSPDAIGRRLKRNLREVGEIITGLPRDLARVYGYLEPVGFILILLLFYSGVMGMILMPMYRLLMGLLLG